MTNSLFKQFYSEENRLKTFQEMGWPLSFLKPESLAKCGFFYLGDSDRVQCPFCGIVIFNWQSGDEPIFEHKIHSSKCPFINGRDVGNIFIDTDPREIYALAKSEDVCGFHHLPTQEKGHPEIKAVEKMIEGPGIAYNPPQSNEFITYGSRLASFKDWPIPDVISPAQLAESGFYFKGPVIDYLGNKHEDFVTCFHCGIALCNWTDEDDPWEEHFKFNSKCNYLLLVARQATSETLTERAPEITTKTTTPTKPSSLTTETETITLVTETSTEPSSEPSTDPPSSEPSSSQSTLEECTSVTASSTPSSSSEPLPSVESSSPTTDETTEPLSSKSPLPPSVEASLTSTETTESSSSISTEECTSTTATTTTTTTTTATATESESESEAATATATATESEAATATESEAATATATATESEAATAATTTTTTTTTPSDEASMEPSLELPSSEPSPSEPSSSQPNIPSKPFIPFAWLPKPKTEDLCCKVCLDYQVGVTFHPCLHTSCPLCAASLTNCPICRTNIIRAIRLDYELSKTKISFYL